MRNRIKNLPRWAQDHITELEGQVSRWKSLAEAVSSKETGTNTRFRLGMDYRGLPNDSCVRFGDDRVWIDVRLDGTELEICANNAIAISPDAANRVHIRVP